MVCLDRGELAAMASPAELLRDPKSMFSELVAETGEQSARNLRARAEECDAARAAGVSIRRGGEQIHLTSPQAVMRKSGSRISTYGKNVLQTTSTRPSC